MKKLFYFLFKITLFQCFIYLLQIPLDKNLLNGGESESEISEYVDGSFYWKRYYNLPLLVIPFYYYSFIELKKNQIFSFINYLIFLLAILATLHRGYFFAISVTTALLVLLNRNLKTILIILLLILILSPFFFKISNRIESGITEIIESLQIDLLNTNEHNNLAFRLSHFLERFNYLIKTPDRIFFGLGFLTEDSPYTKSLSFTTGGANSIDTGDIAWSLLIIFTGIVGTSLYVILYLTLFRFVWIYRENPLSLIATATMITYFLISFTSSTFIDPNTLTIITFLVIFVKKSQENLFYSETINAI
jgi:hypothetical protein